MPRLTTGNRSIAGRVAIVTGAASGMGRATAHLFADEGASVAVVDLQPGRVQAVVDEIRAVHGHDRAYGYDVDVAEPEGLTSMVDDVVRDLGGVDILVNNAGVSMITSAFSPEDDFEEGWARTLDVNLTAHARLIRLCLPHLQASGAGRVVNIASTETVVVTAGLAAYAAT